MKNLLILTVAILLLVGMVVPAAAMDTDEALMDYLVEYLVDVKGLSADALEFRGPYGMELPHLGLNLVVLTWYNQQTQQRGQVAWHQEEQRVVDQDELAELMEAEAHLAAQEWSRLQQEAGKIDVGLYRRLLELDGADQLDVTLVPVLRLSEQLEQQLRELFAQYDLELPPEFLPRFSWSRTGGATYDLGDAATDKAVQPGRVEPSAAKPEDYQGDDSEQARILPLPEPEPLPEEFFAQLEGLIAQGFQQALAAVSAHLDQLNADYEIHNNLVYATLTVNEIYGAAELDHVERVLPQYDVDVDTLPLTGRMPLRQSGAEDADGLELAAAGDAVGGADSANRLRLGLAAGLIIGLAFVAVVLIKNK